MAENIRIIELKGQNKIYSFEPAFKNSKIRKASKFSNVYKGKSSCGKEVIIKVLLKEFSADPLEAEVFRSETHWHNKHPSILAPFEYIYQNGRHYLILDYIHGYDMSDYIKNKLNLRKKRIALAIECGLQILDALEFLHKQGVIHADIKPGNVILETNKKGRVDTKNPKFHLLDFGMARLDKTHPPITNTPKPHFVLMYSPPEQVLEFHDFVSFHSDLHNLALLMYEIIIKEPVYSSAISMLLINLQLSHPIPVKKQIPEELMEILHKASTKPKFTRPHNHYKKSEARKLVEEAIEKRYQNTEEFRKDLLEFKNKWNNR